MPLLPFPTPYPDELLFSTLCRFMGRIEFDNPRLHHLLGMRYNDVNPLFPIPVKQLLELLPTGFLSEDQILQNNTILPFLRPFTSTEFYRALRERSLYGNRFGKDVLLCHKAKVNDLKYCPECASEDVATHGTPYLRRSHQVPGFEACLKHHQTLARFTKHSRDGFKFFPLTQLLKPTTSTAHASELTLTLARDLASVPTVFESLTSNILWPAVHRTVEGPYHRRVKKQRRLSFLQYVQPLRQLLGLDSVEAVYLTAQFRPRRLSASALALLCIRFGGNDPSNFVSEVLKEGPHRFCLCDLTIDGADGGLKRGNTPMMVKECYDGREDRSWEKVPS
jgi:hypothetical protein